MIRILAPVAALALAAVLAAGCGGSSDAAGGDGSAATVANGRPDPSAATESALAFARCMRKEGVPMPDPQPVEGGGGVGFALVGEEMKNVPPARLAAAQKTCEKLLSAFPTPSPEDVEKMTEDALAFAKCMRAHGIDLPDPQVSGVGMTQQILPDRVDVRGPRFQKAADECGRGGGGFFSATPLGEDHK